MKLSVLICTYKRPDLLKGSLSALINRTSEKPDEVIVVNGGGESADRVVEDYVGINGVDVKLIKIENKNLAASRNAGLPYCSGDIIAMTDDDSEVLPDWIARMKRAHAEHPEAGAIGGPVLGINNSLIEKVAGLVTFASYDRPLYVRFVAGVNASYKREAIDRLGPQDEAFFSGEDVDYNWRLLKEDYKIYFDPAIKVYHRHRATLLEFLRHRFRYGRAYYLVRKKWPDMYCVYPHGLKNHRDILKLIYFFLGIIIEPLRYCRRIEGFFCKIAGFFLFVPSQVAWKLGMLTEALTHNIERTRG
jgi:GT2 family glycosyltransferase